jgi:hypothetical protein
MIFNMGCLAVGDEQIEESKSAARAPRGTRQGRHNGPAVLLAAAGQHNTERKSGEPSKYDKFNRSAPAMFDIGRTFAL